MTETKQIISMRLEDSKRLKIQALASRLFIRESDLYEFAICHTLNKLSCLLDEQVSGCDLLLLLLDIRDEINANLNINKHVLFKIINSTQNDFIAMSDIELLMTPKPLIKKYLLSQGETIDNDNEEAALKRYLSNKYHPKSKNR